jgi:hypothetical protein
MAGMVYVWKEEGGLTSCGGSIQSTGGAEEAGAALSPAAAAAAAACGCCLWLLLSESLSHTHTCDRALTIAGNPFPTAGPVCVGVHVCTCVCMCVQHTQESGRGWASKIDRSIGQRRRKPAAAASPSIKSAATRQSSSPCGLLPSQPQHGPHRSRTKLFACVRVLAGVRRPSSSSSSPPKCLAQRASWNRQASKQRPRVGLGVERRDRPTTEPVRVNMLPLLLGVLSWLAVDGGGVLLIDATDRSISRSAAGRRASACVSNNRRSDLLL